MDAEKPDPQDAGLRSPLEGVAAVLWGTASPGRRGPKPKFTAGQIADAGIAIADRDGLTTVTMQHVADRLGVAKMALYRYVPGRTELEALMLDRAFSAPDEHDERDSGWQATLNRWAMTVYTRVLEHPWSVELMQRPHMPGPNELAWFEAGLSTMRDLELTGGEKLDTLAMLVGHVAGIVRQQAAGAAAEDVMAEALAPVLGSTSDYPLTKAAFAHSGEVGRNDALRFGLERMIAGVETLIEARSSGRHASA